MSTAEFTDRFHARIDEGLARIPDEQGRRSASILRHGSLELKVYAPRGRDEQKPHDRDEMYVVVSGRGTFVSAGRRHEFGPGDFLFAPAGVEHRFEDFDDELAVWVMFYGPVGGEASAR